MDEIITEKNTSKFWVVSTVLFFIVLVGAGAYFFFFMNRSYQSLGNPDFDAQLQVGGRLIESGDSAAAASHFQRLLESAQTPAEEGAAQLNIGVARLATDPISATAMLKEVSLNETYPASIRAKAVNYAMNGYIKTEDEEFAREHIFTGPVWGDFLESDNLIKDAVLRAFEFSVALTPTPEATSRVALGYSKLLWSSTGDEKDEYAESALESVTITEELLSEKIATGRIRYGDTHYAEMALAVQLNAMALDALYFNGYEEDLTRVENAFRDAIAVYIDNGYIGTNDLYPRFFYADFLHRLDGDVRADDIRNLLAVMDRMPGSSVGVYLRSKVLDTTANKSKMTKEYARPDTIAHLADISPEFKEGLIASGVTEEQLAVAK